MTPTPLGNPPSQIVAINPFHAGLVGPVNGTNFVIYFTADSAGILGTATFLGRRMGGYIIPDFQLTDWDANIAQTVANAGGIGNYIVQTVVPAANVALPYYGVLNGLTSPAEGFAPADYYAVDNTMPFSVSLGNIALQQYFQIVALGGALTMQFKPYTPGPNPWPLPGIAPPPPPMQTIVSTTAPNIGSNGVTLTVNGQQVTYPLADWNGATNPPTLTINGVVYQVVAQA